MSRRQRVVSIPQWAALIDLAGDGPSLAVARALIDQRHGPQVVQVRRRRRTDAGVRLRDHDAGCATMNGHDFWRPKPRGRGRNSAPRMRAAKPSLVGTR